MRQWRLALAIALYVALDVANPCIPGALVFDADASVEVRQSVRFWATDEATPEAPRPAPEEVRTVVETPRAYVAPPRQTAQVRPALRGLRPAREEDPPSGAFALI